MEEENRKTKRTPSFILELEISFSYNLLNQLLGTDPLSKKKRKRPIVPGTPSFIDKYLRVSNQIYNAVACEMTKRLNKLRHDRDYQRLCSECKKYINKGEDTPKEVLDELYSVKDKYQYSLFDSYNFVTGVKHYFRDKLGIDECQSIAEAAFKAVEKLKSGDAESIRYRRIDETYSVEGTSVKSTIRYLGNRCIQIGKDHKFALIVKKNDSYAKEALAHRVKYTRILVKEIRGRRRYYAQLVLEGYPPDKKNRVYGSDKSSVGLDEGTSTIAVVSDTEVSLNELAPGTKTDEAELRRLNRAIERSRRANNPENYNKDGTVKKSGKKNRLKWNKSNRCRKLEQRRRELYRRSACKRKYSHNLLANHIISLGTDIKVENMSIKGLQKKSNKSSVNKNNGKNISKHRFGKTVMSRAPASLINAIDRKLQYIGSSIKKVNTYSVKASQYNHINDSYIKKPLGTRYETLEGNRVQRDLYSAYLIKNTNQDLSSINRNACIKGYGKFKEMQDAEVERLRLNGNKTMRWYVAY